MQLYNFFEYFFTYETRAAGHFFCLRAPDLFTELIFTFSMSRFIAKMHFKITIDLLWHHFIPVLWPDCAIKPGVTLWPSSNSICRTLSKAALRAYQQKRTAAARVNANPRSAALGLLHISTFNTGVRPHVSADTGQLRGLAHLKYNQTVEVLLALRENVEVLYLENKNEKLQEEQPTYWSKAKAMYIASGSFWWRRPLWGWEKSRKNVTVVRRPQNPDSNFHKHMQYTCLYLAYVCVQSIFFLAGCLYLKIEVDRETRWNRANRARIWCVHTPPGEMHLHNALKIKCWPRICIQNVINHWILL